MFKYLIIVEVGNMNLDHENLFINELFRVNRQCLQSSKLIGGLEFRCDFSKQLLIETVTFLIKVLCFFGLQSI